MEERSCGIVKLKLLGYLGEELGREHEIEVCGERSIEDLIDVRRLGMELEDLVILVNGKGASPKEKVSPGDTVTILPHISGGSLEPLVGHYSIF